MGRLAEAEGEREIYRDLRMKIFIDPDDMKAQYQKSPAWLKALMNAWADGLNYYLHTHPTVAPRVITRFEPWMALTFSEGSIGVDNIDEYLETIVKKNDGVAYKYGADERPMKTSTIAVPYKTANGLAKKDFTIYRTHHGPIVREADGKWVAVRLMQEPLKALTQSYSRTKAKSYQAFRDSMELH